MLRLEKDHRNLPRRNKVGRPKKYPFHLMVDVGSHFFVRCRTKNKRLLKKGVNSIKAAIVRRKKSGAIPQEWEFVWKWEEDDGTPVVNRKGLRGIRVTRIDSQQYPHDQLS